MLTCPNLLNKQLLSEEWIRASELEYLEFFSSCPREFNLASMLESGSSQATDYTGTGLFC